ncbi:hypothetical protein M434DRAFT_35015 [Hypoxylon sp. CO27-5]|nr:hypothetical protein M434DRAFT_35015 [Hypoxylon sp. CO27-5]
MTSLHTYHPFVFMEFDLPLSSHAAMGKTTKEDASITLVIPNSKQSHAARDLSRFHLHGYGGLQDWYVQSQRISVQGKVPVRSPLSAPPPNRDFERSDPEHQITVPMVTVPDKAASHAGQRTEVASQLNPTGYLRK